MIAFTVYGTPAPQGSKSFKGHAKSGRAILVESSKKVKPWRMDVKAAAESFIASADQMRETTTLVAHRGVRVGDRFYPFPLDLPLRVTMTFTLPKPGSEPKRKRSWPMRKPDGSKLQRSTEDALTDAGLIRDDARIVEWVGAKRYPNEGIHALDRPGCVITIEVIS